MTNEIEHKLKAAGVQLMDSKAISAVGRELSDIKPRAPEPDDVAVIAYTAGVDGAPKGVMLTHANLVAAVTAQSESVKLQALDRYLSYLPTGNIMELVNILHCLLSGSLVRASLNLKT